MKLIDKVDAFLRQEAHKYTDPDRLATNVEIALGCRCFACEVIDNDVVGFEVHHANKDSSCRRFAGYIYINWKKKEVYEFDVNVLPKFK